MEPEQSGSFIDHSKDYIYTGSDRKCFPVCFTCGQYSPFLIFLGTNKNSIKFQPHAGRTQLFCPICTPDPEHFRKHFHGEQLYRADSILNDRKFLDLLNRYAYFNPYFELYSDVDRIIITENTQLCAAYKSVAKQKLPKTFKMKLLMNLFPATHRFPNKKFASTEELSESIMGKYNDICISYMNISETGGSQLLDNFDFLIDKTPLVERITNQKTVPARELQSYREPAISDSSVENVILNDSDAEIRAFSDSDDELASIASGGNNRQRNESTGSTSSLITIVSSYEIEGRNSIVPSSQSLTQPSQTTEMSSSIDISSQSVGQGTAIDISVSDSSNSKDSTNIEKPRATRRPLPTPNDGQQPGPSNTKRRRLGHQERLPPTNPTPNEVLKQPLGRLPRLDGG